MDESMWERYGATAGIVFVVLLVGSLFFAPAPPHVDASAKKIGEYFGDHRKAILTQQMMSTFAIVFFIWFVGHLRHVLQRAEGGTEALSPVVYGAGIALAAAGAMACLPPAILAYGANRPDAFADAGLTRALYDGYLMVGNVMLIMSGLFVAATGLAMVRKELVATWLGWAGLGVAVISWASGIAGFYVSTHNAFWYASGFVGLTTFAAFILVASVLMVRQPEVARAAAPRPVFSS
jgi:hypothetical protein